MLIETPNDLEFKIKYTKHCKFLKLRGMQPKTVDAYARAIRRIGNHFDCKLDNLKQDQLLDYFYKLLNSHSWSAVKLDLYGLKFFYTHVLNKTWVDIPLIKPPKTTRIRDIITIEQANQLFTATDTLSYRVFLFTLYSLGLRLSEGLILSPADIDADRMQVHIRDSKGNKDRLVPLPQKTLDILRQFWLHHRHSSLLFPNRKRGLRKAHLAESPLDRGGIQMTIKAVIKQLGIKKKLLAIHYATATPLTYLKPGLI